MILEYVCVICRRPMWRLGLDERDGQTYCLAHDPRRVFVIRSVLIAPVMKTEMEMERAAS